MGSTTRPNPSSRTTFHPSSPIQTRSRPQLSSLVPPIQPGARLFSSERSQTLPFENTLHQDLAAISNWSLELRRVGKLLKTPLFLARVIHSRARCAQHRPTCRQVSLCSRILCFGLGGLSAEPSLIFYTLATPRAANTGLDGSSSRFAQKLQAAEAITRAISWREFIQNNRTHKQHTSPTEVTAWRSLH